MKAIKSIGYLILLMAFILGSLKALDLGEKSFEGNPFQYLIPLTAFSFVFAVIVLSFHYNLKVVGSALMPFIITSFQCYSDNHTYIAIISLIVPFLMIYAEKRDDIRAYGLVKAFDRNSANPPTKTNGSKSSSDIKDFSNQPNSTPSSPIPKTQYESKPYNSGNWTPGGGNVGDTYGGSGTYGFGLPNYYGAPQKGSDGNYYQGGKNLGKKPGRNT